MTETRMEHRTAGTHTSPSAESPGPQQRRPEPDAVPNVLLSVAVDERSPADDLIWEWSRWAPLAAPMSLLADPDTAEDDNPWWGPAPEPEPAIAAVPAIGDDGRRQEKQELANAVDVGGLGPVRGVAPPLSVGATGQGEIPDVGSNAAEVDTGAGSATSEPSQGAREQDDSLAGAGGLQRWSAQVRTAVGRRIRPPTPADPEGVEIPLRESVTAVRRREGLRRGGATRAVKAAIPKAPDLPEGLPSPPPIPVPEAETAVAAAVGLKLVDQVLPKLQDYTYISAEGPKAGKPQVFHPQVAPRLPSGSGNVLTPVPPPPKAGRQGRKEVAAVTSAGEKIAQQVAGEGSFTLGTVPAPGARDAPPGPPVSKADITGVLVRLRGSVQADSEAMLTGVREGLFPMKALQFELPQLGSAELVPELRTSTTQAIDMIATQAGIDLETLHTATIESAAKVEEHKRQEHETTTKAGAKTRADTEAEAKASADTDAGARDAADAAIAEKTSLAHGGANPQQIRAQRDKLVQRVNRRLAPEDVRYEREGEDRVRALGLMEIYYSSAYQNVARQVAARIKKDAEPPASKRPATAKVTAKPAAATSAAPTTTSADTPPPPPSTAPPTPAENWSLERGREVGTRFAELRKEAQTATKAHRDAVVRARTLATNSVHDWADREIGDRSTAWERIWERVLSWGKEATDVAQAWEEARMATLHADLQGDLAFVADLESGARSEAEMRALAGLGGLSDAQKAIVETYFSAPPPHDRLTAVAAGMRLRIVQMRKPRLIEQLNDLLYTLPPEQWRPVATVAESEGGGVSIVERGNRFHASVDQWGTDESKLYASLTGLTKLQRHALDLWYRKVHGSTIDTELKDELEDAELDRAQALMRGDEIAAEAAAIRDAIEGAGTDEEEIYRALRNKSTEDRARLEAIYLDRYKVSLSDDLKSDLSGEELKRAQALQQGETARADAIGLQHAQSGKWHGGADTDAIQAIYAQNRSELEDKAKAQGWTADELNRQVLARNQQIDEAHKGEYRSAAGDPGAGLRASFEKNLRGPARDLALGLHDQDWARADAARLELERRSFITDDKVVNQILESQYTRARTEVSLDQEHDLALRRDLAAVRGERWDDKAQRTAMRAEIDTKSIDRSQGYVKSLKARYDTNYKYDPLYAVDGRGGFDNLIADHLMGSDKDRALALVDAGGHLSPAKEIKYAVQGAGTDLDVIKRVLDGKTPTEMADIEKEWDTLYPKGPKLRDRVMDEVSGRDAFDVGELLKGAPQTPQEKLLAARRKQTYEKKAYLLGNKFSKGEANQLDDEVAALEKTVKRLESVDPAADEATFLRWKTDQGIKAVDAAVEEHRRSVDWLADTMAMVAAITAGLLVTALTFGAAGPVIAGALGALAAAEATILAKIAVKGGAYSDEELLVDVVSGAVDVVFAVATAGVGNALMRVSKGVPIGPLAKLATSASRSRRMLAHGLANGVEGFLGGIPSAAAGALVDEKTWSNGNVLTTVASAAGMGGATGALMGGVMGSAGGIGKAAPHGPHLDPARPPDLEAAAKAFEQSAPGAAADPAARTARAGQWHAHQAQHPTASYADFLADLDAGRIAPDPAAASTFATAAREALASGLPSSERALVADVAVHVLSDADFGRLTRSGSGLAVTVIRDGRPVILMRESAPLGALREEGIHVAQALDPRLGADVRLLDESRMAQWGSLDLGTKLDMYRAKLDLELDAHGRLLAGLLDQIDDLPPGAARTALVDQAGAARRNMANLTDRRVELSSFGPLDRLAARFGRGTLALRLEQPPRLFTKGPLKAGAAKAKPAATSSAPVTKPPKRPRQILAPDPAQLGRPPDTAAPRRALGKGERSPQAAKEGVLSVEQVGAAWREQSHRGAPPVAELDPYRRVEVTKVDPTSPSGTRVLVVDETVVRGSDPPRWVRRGKDAGEAGAIAEEASLAMTRRNAQTPRPDGATVVTLGARQNASGHGFDEVYAEFHPDGRVEIVVVEVKDYGGRHVPFEDFTAVTENLRKNLADLKDAILVPRSELPLALRELPSDQLRALRRNAAGLTSADPRVTLEVRLGPDTKLGGQTAKGRPDTALRELEKIFPGAPVRQERLSTVDIELARQVAALELPDVSAARLADLHKGLAAKGLISSPMSPVKGRPGVFTDASGAATSFRSVTVTDIGRVPRLDREAIERVAAETVAALMQPISVPPAATYNLRVILDVADLDLHTRLWFEHVLDRQLAATGRSAELSTRLHIE